MSIKDIKARCWILAIFIRDDGQRFVLGDGAYEFKDTQQHFTANTMDNDTVEVQGNDGILLAGQVYRPSVQSFDGYIATFGVSKTITEQYRQEFLGFFLKNHFYTVIYLMPDGSAIKRQRGFIVDVPEVKELWQISPEYHVALNFEDVNYYDYEEGEGGEEIYSKMALIPLYNASGGGAQWDSVGLVWDSVGAVWEAGSGGGAPEIMVESISTIYPVWTVTGPANNPTLENLTTGQTLSYAGHVTASQTLKIDMNAQTATLNGTNVLRNVSGSWVSFASGLNKVQYSTQNDDAPTSKIEWNEVVG